MTCKHCTMREVKRGNVIYSEGERYDDPPFHTASIEEDYDGFWLWCERRNLYDDCTEFACIPIRHCPWCGQELKGGGDE